MKKDNEANATVVSNEDISVIVIKDGEARQIYNLPMKLKDQLIEYYNREPVVGISKKCYVSMEQSMERRLLKYRRLLIASKGTPELFDKAVAFAKAFEIYYEDSPLLFELMCWIDRMMAEKAVVTSRSINCRSSLAYLNRGKGEAYTYKDVAKEFSKVKKAIFGDDSEIKVGFIKFLKFYFAINRAEISMA
jgi:hypothetical protein